MKKKRLEKIKIKNGIFQKLVISYILFSILTVLASIVSLLLSAFEMTEGDMMAFIPYDVIDENGNITDSATVTNLGGWIEELDENYRIVQVYGTKKTEQQQYSANDIFRLTDFDADETEPYVGFIRYVEQQHKYYLVIYDRSVMQLSFNVNLDATEGMGTKRWLHLFEITFLILFLSNCILISLYLRRKIKKPLDAMVQGMERVKAGESDVTLEFRAEAEFEQIRDTFNLMTEQLEREKQEKAELVQKKNQLLLELSHDIKTPIATIKSYANALEAGLVPEEKKQIYYHTIDLKADRIQQLSEDMFLMLKMDYADYQLRLVEVDVCELLRKICAEYYEDVEHAGLSFDIEIPEQVYMLTLDIGLFSRVIGNLLSNAMKYNRTGSLIVVHVYDTVQGLIIDIEDDGIQIGQTICERIFDSFMRGDKARKSDGGTGLGLAISKAIIEKHNGSICYKWENQRNCFRIRFQHSCRAC